MGSVTPRAAMPIYRLCRAIGLPKSRGLSLPRGFCRWFKISQLLASTRQVEPARVASDRNTMLNDGKFILPMPQGVPASPHEQTAASKLRDSRSH